jgi:ferredoxin
MSRPIWFVNLLKKAYPGRFLAARFTNIPVINHLVDYGLFEGDDIVYLPKDTTIQINEPIEKPDEFVLPSQVVEHFIQETNHHWIMNFCICRDGANCQDYPIEMGCLFLGEAVLKINPQLGRLVTRDEAFEHARNCRDADLVHMIGRNKLDTIWLGVKPGKKLVTICNCCPCCCLWGMIPHLSPLIGDKVKKMPGVTITVTNQCSGCEICLEDICFVDAIHMVDGRAVINDSCRGCGRCVEVCPNGAIEITVEDGTFVNKTIDHLDPLFELN